MYHIIYQTTNLVNGKIYIGAHSTPNLHDEYLGSGIFLKKSIKKHGRSNFKKDILHIFDNPKEMYDKEREIVNEAFIKNRTNYNFKLGGSGGSSPGKIYSKHPQITKEKLKSKLIGRKLTTEHKDNISKSLKGNPKLKSMLGKKLSTETKEKIAKASIGRNVGRTHSPETKMKMKLAWQKRKQKAI